MTDDDSRAQVFVVRDGFDPPHLSAEVLTQEVDVHLPTSGVLIRHGDHRPGETRLTEGVADRLQ
ncbi:hypothetical protein BFN03_17735 [Rhodococcus sp. WMMA185]|nr:hypothetical protein BFN03_17735 [Rhodococcus sp. WMMA185]